MLTGAGSDLVYGGAPLGLEGGSVGLSASDTSFGARILSSGYETLDVGNTEQVLKYLSLGTKISIFRG